MKPRDWLTVLFVVVAMCAFFMAFPGDAKAACSSPTSRPGGNASANSVLTSTKYNGDLNTIYSYVNNDLSGDCLADSSITNAKLATSVLSSIRGTTRDGCKVSYNSANTLDIGPCRINLTDGSEYTSTATASVSFGCTDCTGSDSASVYRYVAIKSGESVFTPIITADPPLAGTSYDASDNRVLAKFWNNRSSAINKLSIAQRESAQFVADGSLAETQSLVDISVSSGTIGWDSTPAEALSTFRRVDRYGVHTWTVHQDSAGTSTGTAVIQIGLPDGYDFQTTEVFISTSGSLAEGTNLGSCTLESGGDRWLGMALGYDNDDYKIWAINQTNNAIWNGSLLSLQSQTTAYISCTIRAAIEGFSLDD